MAGVIVDFKPRPEPMTPAEVANLAAILQEATGG